MDAHILVIEDDACIRDGVARSLRAEGFCVSAAANGSDGLATARARTPDLILLDLVLPDLSGLEVCRRVRQDRALADIPIIMVTAKDDEVDIVVGLGTGADDYLTKPFRIRELLARMDAVLRRVRQVGNGEQESLVRYGPFEIQPARHRLLVDGEPVPLTATEFRLLHLLVRYPGRVYDRDVLLHRLGRGTVSGGRSIDVHVRAIRKKLGERHTWVETVRGVGYRCRDDAI